MRASSSRWRSAAASASRRRAALERAERDDEDEEQQRDRAERAAERLAEGQGIAVEDDEDLSSWRRHSRFAADESNERGTGLTAPRRAIIRCEAKRENEADAMALRPIIILPDPKLRLVSAPLGQVDDALRKLMDDMVETMHDAPGIGLAAIQIAEPSGSW